MVYYLYYLLCKKISKCETARKKKKWLCSCRAIFHCRETCQSGSYFIMGDEYMQSMKIYDFWLSVSQLPKMDILLDNINIRRRRPDVEL